MQAIELSTTISAQGGNRLERQANLRQALAAVAQAGTFAHVEDAGAWQREVRVERPQPGRADSFPCGLPTVTFSSALRQRQITPCKGWKRQQTR